MNGQVRSPDERIAELENRLLLYEAEARRTVGELARARELIDEQGAARPQETLRLLKEVHGALDLVQQSRFWQLRQRYIQAKIRAGLAPPHVGDLFDFHEQIDDLVERHDPYHLWMEQHTPRDADLSRMRATAPHLGYRPTISVLVPVYDTPEPYLRAMLDSVIRQAYPYWELCIADDASPSAHVQLVLREYAEREPRIKPMRRAENGHISRASNDALALVSGEFTALLDHDDVLAPEALYAVIIRLNQRPDADMLYSDEDKIDERGQRSNAFFKPDWSPDSFLSRMYTAHLAVFRTSLLRELGGFRLGFEGSQDYDLVLRLTERTDKIEHLPEVLYHWRIHSGSVAGGSQAKPYAHDAALRALNEAMERRGEGGRVEHKGEDRGNYVVRYEIRRPGKVSVIIPTRDHAEDLRTCVESIFARTTYPDYEIVLLDNGSVKPETARLLAEYERLEPARFRALRYDVPFNYSKINNYAARAASGSYLLFLNNDTEVLEDDWMTMMVEQAQRREIGAVGGKLLYKDGTVQHAGVVIGVGGVAGHAFRNFPSDHDGYYNFLSTANNYSAVTAACMMMRRDVFDEVSGFDEELSIAYNDVDLCLRIRAKGYRIIYLPYVKVSHFESKSRGYDTTREQEERDRRERLIMQRKWNIINFRDPYYNPNLTLLREDFSLAP